jgi:polar amino acid transport system ATP-binding protein
LREFNADPRSQSVSQSSTPTVLETPAVRMTQVQKEFGGHMVVKSMDLTVASGEKLVIIGPSGSGKTTILRLIMTLETPDNGHIEIDGELLGCAWESGRIIKNNSKNLRAVRSKVGMVFQHFNLFPHMSVLDNIMEAPVRSLRMPKEEARERAIGLLRRVDMVEKASSYPGQLSGGQQQRVAIARALAMRPSVMLFDEVTSALDPEKVGEILQTIRELAAEVNMAMVIVTHEMGFARNIADRVIFMDHGQIVESGPPDEVLGAPVHPRTTAFLKAILDR